MTDAPHKPEPEPGDGSRDGAGPRGWTLALLGLAIALAFSIAVRVAVTEGDPYWDPQSPAGLLRSDQGLIYYVTERIADANGGLPEDFRADPRIRHPGTADIPAMFSVGQEFLIAWTFLALDRSVPLHVVALWVMSVVASLILVAVFGLVLEWTGRPRLAALAALLFAVLPINYRTLGILLLREDLSFPLFAFHLWATARAVRRGSTPAWIASGLTLAAALATWHAMTFVVAIEAVTLGAWYVRSGRNPMAVPRAWIVPALVALACVTVPMLASKLFLFSPTMSVVIGLGVVAALEGRARRKGAERDGQPQERGSAERAPADLRLSAVARRALLAAGCVLAVGTAAHFAARMVRGGAGDYDHVIAFLKAKVTGFGRLPDESSSLPFGARLLWQGPFATAQPLEFLKGLGLGLPILLTAIGLAVPVWLRGRGTRAEAGSRAAGFPLLTGFMAISFVSAWMVRRTMILLGLGAPILAVWPFLKSQRERLAAPLLGLVILLQGGFILYSVRTTEIPWYQPPYQPDNYPGEIRHLVEWVEEHVDPDQALLGDFIISTSILAHSKHPIVTQPKYETTESRERIEQFFTIFFKGSMADLDAMMDRYQADYLFLDCWQLAGSFYMAGMPAGARGPIPGSPAATFLRRNPEALRSIPGYELVYTTPEGLGRGSFRVFRRRR